MPVVAATFVPSFPHRRGEHCGSAALRDLLEHHRLDYGAGALSESFVFGIGGGLHFLYSEGLDRTTPVHWLGRSPGLECDVCRHLGLELELRETDDPALGWAWLRDEIDAGCPTMVWADIKHLEYLDVRLHNSHHDVIAIEHDPEREMVWLADHHCAEIQPASYASLARARNSCGFPGPNRHATWILRFPSALPELRPAVTAAVSRAIANMREDEPPPGTPFSFGLAGVDRFVEGFPSWPRRFGDQLPAALKCLRIFVARAGTGGALFRSLFAGFLDEAAGLLEDNGLHAAARAYHDLTAAWRELAATARGRDALAAHGECVPLVRKVGAVELAGVEALERSGYAGAHSSAGGVVEVAG